MLSNSCEAFSGNSLARIQREVGISMRGSSRGRRRRRSRDRLRRWRRRAFGSRLRSVLPRPAANRSAYRPRCGRSGHWQGARAPSSRRLGPRLLRRRARFATLRTRRRRACRRFHQQGVGAHGGVELAPAPGGIDLRLGQRARSLGVDLVKAAQPVGSLRRWPCRRDRRSFRGGRSPARTR